MPIKFLLLGRGGGCWGFFAGGGWKCQFYFYGRRDVSECKRAWIHIRYVSKPVPPSHSSRGAAAAGYGGGAAAGYGAPGGYGSVD